MSAELLREAAAKVREDFAAGNSDADDPFLPALAAWLEATATKKADSRFHGWLAGRESSAVARAYLGRDS